MGKPFYSFGIIFKNEIRCLERCLKSLQGLRDAVPCEVVMADTGSSDGSREVAERYADILIDFPWIDDFAAARNAVMDRCSGVWYFSIDADEWMDSNFQELVDFYRARKTKFQYNFGGVQIRNYMSKNGESADRYSDFFGIRMMRLSTGIRYVGCIHEHWLNEEGGRSLSAMTFGRTLLHHDGYLYETKAAERAKYERNISLLKKKLEEDPDDLQTLLECIDSCKTYDGEASVEYVKRSIRGVNEKRFAWERFGPIVFRNAVCVATLQNLPEIEGWIDEALERFPDSIFTRVDVNYYAFAYYWTKKDYGAAIRYGEAYLRGAEDYEAGQYDTSENMRGIVDNISPYWKGKVVSMLPFAYLECGEPEKAYAMFQKQKAEDIGNNLQIGLCVQTLLWLHRVTTLDTPSLMADFWEQIAQPDPESKEAKDRRTAVMKDSARSFTLQCMEEEEKEEGFRRHSCTVFTALEGKCSLGDAAAILLEEDPGLLAEKVARFENLNELPASALIHALERGMSYPLPGRAMRLEEMDELAARLAREKGRFFPLVRRAAQRDFGENIQTLLWTRGLALAAVRSFGWGGEDADVAEGLETARIFARVEGRFLPVYYAPEMLREENLCVLPSLHRFGACCVRAFAALEAGDAAGYVRLLREGLAMCESVKAMVEFLLDHTPELQRPAPSAELLALAEQVRAVLARFAPDDPAVAMLKQSEAYQKVAHLIEGVEAVPFGGLKQ